MKTFKTSKSPAWGANARPQPLVPQVAPAIQFRGEIESALRDGHSLDDLTLRLSHRAADSLKRDRSLLDADISYAGGGMRFLGVAVVIGPEASRLERAAIPGSEG